MYLLTCGVWREVLSWRWRARESDGTGNSLIKNLRVTLGKVLCLGEVDPYICPLWLWMSRSQPHPVSIGHDEYLDGAHGQQVRSLSVTDSNREATKAVWLGEKKKVGGVQVCIQLCERQRETQQESMHRHTLLDRALM